MREAAIKISEIRDALNQIYSFPGTEQVTSNSLPTEFDADATDDEVDMMDGKGIGQVSQMPSNVSVVHRWEAGILLPSSKRVRKAMEALIGRPRLKKSHVIDRCWRLLGQC
eukprot:2923203-Amphidinium_carterae.1